MKRYMLGADSAKVRRRFGNWSNSGRVIILVWKKSSLVLRLIPYALMLNELLFTLRLLTKQTM